MPMLDEPKNVSPGLVLNASAQSDKQPPSWMSEVTAVLQYWKVQGWIEPLKTLRVPGQVKRYEAYDFFLVLVAYSVSHERSLRAFYRAAKPVKGALMAMWDRRRMPSRPRLSNFLKGITPSMIETFRLQFQSAVTAGLLQVETLGGLIDHRNHRHAVFDLDPTKQATIQRTLPHDEEHPPTQRRRADAVAAGYSGRKRADAIRSRMTVLFTSAMAWVFTRGQPGNGHRETGLEQACRAIVQLLQGLAIRTVDSLVRFDGEYGYARWIAQIQSHHLGYLGRCVDYRLLHSPEVTTVLQGGSNVSMRHVDSGVEREVFDVPRVHWSDADNKIHVTVRIVVTRTRVREDGTKHRIGKRIGDWVYELFVTDLDPWAVTAPEVVSLYLGRGAMEGELAREDAESGIDRWVSDFTHGQELWQILSQYCSHARTQLGHHVVQRSVERTMVWEVPTTPILPIPVVLEQLSPPLDAPSEDPMNEQRIPSIACDIPSTMPQSEAAGSLHAIQQPKRFEVQAFHRQVDGSVVCPQGHRMKLTERRTCRSGLRLRYEAPVKKCVACPVAVLCRGPDPSPYSGRRVNLRVISPTEEIKTPTPIAVLEQSESSIAPTVVAEIKTPERVVQADEMVVNEVKEPVSLIELAPQSQPVLLGKDQAAAIVRRLLRETLQQERVTIQIGPMAVILPQQTTLLETRDQRAHRRKTWNQRFAANARGPQDPPIQVHLAGIPDRLARLLNLDRAA
jgi:hypothetical protein